MNSEPKEIYMPLSILRIYYHTLSGVTEVNDTPTQTMWLLSELFIEHERKSSDDLIQSDAVHPLITFPEKTFEPKKTLEKLNSILSTIDQLERDMRKQQHSKDREDLLVVKEVSEPVILSAEQLKGIDEDQGENRKKKREVDELW